MDDECQIEEYQHVHSVREECHLEGENSCAGVNGGGKTTPKPLSHHMPESGVLLMKCTNDK